MSFADAVAQRYTVTAKEWKPNSWFKAVEKWLKTKDGFNSWEHWASMHGHDIEGLADVDEGMSEKQKQAAIKNYYQNVILEEVLDNLSDAEVVGNKMKIYRCISLKDSKEFLDSIENEDDAKPLGVYWTFSKDHIGCWGGGSNVGEWWVLEGWVNVKDIDTQQSVLKNMQGHLEHEREIMLETGADVELVQLYSYKKPSKKFNLKKIKRSA